MVNFSSVRGLKNKFPPRLVVSTDTRKYYTVLFNTALVKTIKHLGTPVPSQRSARLAIASEIFGREITSFNDLLDSELWALEQWVTLHKKDAYSNFEAWLGAKYGEQLTLGSV